MRQTWRELLGVFESVVALPTKSWTENRGDPIDLAQFVHERYQTASPATP